MPSSQCQAAAAWVPALASAGTQGPPTASRTLEALATLCLAGGLWEQRGPGARKAAPTLWVLPVGSAQQPLKANAEPGLAALQPPLGPEGTLAPSCGHLLEQHLSGSPPLSGSAAPGASLASGDMLVGFPASPCLKHQEGPYKLGRSSPQAFQRPEANLPQAPPVRPSAPDPSCQDSLLPLLRQAGTEAWMKRGGCPGNC